MNLLIRELNEDDPAIISDAFQEQGWNKPVELYEGYLSEQKRGERITLVAEADGAFAGYVNVVWKSFYSCFRDSGIPEISDFNVLIKYRRMGIGSALMDQAEAVISERSAVAGIGVGIFSDYGHAQILYVKRGYVPDGRGIHNGQRHIQPGENIVVDDDIVLYFAKHLR
ncbi:GNAT family N-acetyltransferase [Paenibacillus sp. M1]|uniref:GNAT family N-acetyltransferase n=1 Tax=Paenibacillus haidiansis TaxID=1574488 RepID=A0ABU7VNM4_9BACL